MRWTKYGTHPVPDSRNATRNVGEAVEHATHRQRGERHHLVDRERQAVHLRVVGEPLARLAAEGSCPGALCTATARSSDAHASKNGSNVSSSRFASPTTGGIVTATAPRPRRALGFSLIERATSCNGTVATRLQPFRVVAAHLREQPVVVRARDVEREPGVVVRRESDDQSAEEDLYVDALGVHVREALVEIGRAGRARRTDGGVDRHAAAGADLGRVELAADLPRPSDRPTARRTTIPDAAPRARSTRADPR